MGLGLSSISSAQCVGVGAGSSWDVSRWSRYPLQHRPPHPTPTPVLGTSAHQRRLVQKGRRDPSPHQLCSPACCKETSRRGWASLHCLCHSRQDPVQSACHPHALDRAPSSPTPHSHPAPYCLPPPCASPTRSSVPPWGRDPRVSSGPSSFLV